MFRWHLFRHTLYGTYRFNSGVLLYNGVHVFCEFVIIYSTQFIILDHKWMNIFSINDHLKCIQTPFGLNYNNFVIFLPR